MMATMLLNQEDTAFGLNSLRTTISMGFWSRFVRPFEEGRNAIVDDAPDVSGADAGLLHRGCVDVHLDGGVASGAQIAFEARREGNDEHVLPPVHRVLHGVRGDLPGILEARRIEGVEQFLGERRLVLVHERDRGVVDLARGPGGLDLDREGECIDDEDDHDSIAHQAAEFLEPEPEDVQQRGHGYFSCFFRPTKLMARKTGMQPARNRMSPSMRPGRSPLV